MTHPHRIRNMTHLEDAQLDGGASFPGCLVNGRSPYDEQVMSMPTAMTTDVCAHIPATTETCAGHYFFFLFNFDNYYHFLYDTLPYLHFYKILCSYSLSPVFLLVSSNIHWRPFHKEMFSLLGIPETAFCVARDGVKYEHLYVPTSLTHGHLLTGEWASNLPPEPDAYNIWIDAMKRALALPRMTAPLKIYISRRSHIHGDMSNIGTNYTTRRRCVNEDEVVETVRQFGYTEVFCETQSMTEKIQMFGDVTHVIGFIGGGMANLLFSPEHVRVGCITTPDFLRINSRFRFSMEHTQIHYLPITTLASYTGSLPPYVRVRIVDMSSVWANKIGEVDSFVDSSGAEVYCVRIASGPVAGFALESSDSVRIHFRREQLEPLDAGLNSPFSCDIAALRKYLESSDE